ncbi:hypothetical protein Tco_0501408, partial [Tanacetum coccineum]
ATTAGILDNFIIYIVIQLKKQTSRPTGSCQLPRPKTPDALPDQCLLVCPDLQLQRC